MGTDFFFEKLTLHADSLAQLYLIQLIQYAFSNWLLNALKGKNKKCIKQSNISMIHFFKRRKAKVFHSHSHKNPTMSVFLKNPLHERNELGIPQETRKYVKKEGKPNEKKIICFYIICLCYVSSKCIIMWIFFIIILWGKGREREEKMRRMGE